MRDTQAAAFAAAKQRAPSIKAQIMSVIREHHDRNISGNWTPEELLKLVQEKFGTSTVITTIRARCTDLVRAGRIVDSGERRKAFGGKLAAAYRLKGPWDK